MSDKHTMRGKWSQPGVPHKGSSCVGIDDAGEPSHRCEMCEAHMCRFVREEKPTSMSTISATRTHDEQGLAR